MSFALFFFLLFEMILGHLFTCTLQIGLSGGFDNGSKATGRDRHFSQVEPDLGDEPSSSSDEFFRSFLCPFFFFFTSFLCLPESRLRCFLSSLLPFFFFFFYFFRSLDSSRYCSSSSSSGSSSSLSPWDPRSRSRPPSCPDPPPPPEPPAARFPSPPPELEAAA